VKPGRTPREVGAIIDAGTAARGLGDKDLELYGHGMSTFWLGPLIPARPASPEPGDTVWAADEPFRNGQVFTAETIVHEPGVGTAGFEDLFIIWDEGNELITSTPLLFW